jgi:hypothetical protein
MNAPAPDRLLPSRRRERGSAHAASCLNYWLAKSEMSAEALAAIASWGLGEKSGLMSSNVSHLRNARITRLNLKLIDGIAGANLAIWRWHVQGADACLQAFGPLSTWEIRPEWLNRAIWLHHPDDESDPLQFADWCEIFAGYLTLDYVGLALAPTENLSPAIAQLLGELTAGAGTIMDGLRAVERAYPVTDRERVDLLLDVVTGRRDYTRDQLESEIATLAITVSRLRGEPDGSLSPEALHSELTRRSNDRRRT